MSILVIGEKSSVSRELAKVLGANAKKNGCLEGNGYVVSWCFGSGRIAVSRRVF